MDVAFRRPEIGLGGRAPSGSGCCRGASAFVVELLFAAGAEGGGIQQGAGLQFPDQRLADVGDIVVTEPRRPVLAEVGDCGEQFGGADLARGFPPGRGRSVRMVIGLS